MVDVLLIQPPIRDFYLTAKRTVPYGLGCIAEALSAEGFDVAIHDALASRKSRPLPLPAALGHLKAYYGAADISPFALFHQFRHFGHTTTHIGNAAAASGAFLIGISALFTAYSDEALETAAAVRAACPAAFIVMGGHHPTGMPDAVLRHPAPDAVLRGEGEVGMPILARCLQQGGDLSLVPGIALRRASGTPLVRPPAVMTAPDRYPWPGLNRFHDRHYRRRHRVGITLVTSRGCPMACSYCATGRHSYLTYRRRSVDTVLAEIRAAADRGAVGFIDFEDENLALDRDAFLRLLDGIRTIFGDEPPELRAMNGLYPPSLDAALIRAMHEAGFRSLNLSLGTSCPDQARRFNRAHVTDAFDGALDAAADCGLKAVGYIIIGAPGQTAATSVDDLIYLARRRVLAGLSVYYPAPGSSDFERCRRLGRLPVDVAAYRATAIPMADGERRLKTVTLMRLGRMVNFMKQLKDEGADLGDLPRGAAASDHGSRYGAGMALLRRFFDGEGIWGMSPEGTPFLHRVSETVLRRFIDGCHPSQIRGTR
jgi:anaerobic magnesium-protoporphyrin IX monomethyl ester cyclase